jgi:hypothetical protein
MSTTKKFLKTIRESHDANLPVHSSDAATEMPDSLEGKVGARSVKPEVDGTKAGMVSKKVAAEAAEDEDMKESHEDALPVHSSDAAVQVPDKLAKSEVSEGDEVRTSDLAKKAMHKSWEEKEAGHEEACDDDMKESAAISEADLTIESEEEDALSDEEKKEVKESIEALTGDDNLPEDFKVRVASIFEAAVKRTAKKRLASHKKKLVESYNEKLAQTKNEISEALVDKVDSYLDYVVEEWMKENEVAIEGSLRSEITEKFIVGLKNLFENHYIEIPAEKANVVAQQENKIAQLEKDLNEELAKSVELRKENIRLNKTAIVKKHCEGMTVSDAAKLEELCEGVTFENAATFGQKLKVIKETYFPKTPKCSVDLDASLLVEGGLTHEEPAQATTEVDVYAETISRMVKRS